MITLPKFPNPSVQLCGTPGGAEDRGEAKMIAHLGVLLVAAAAVGAQVNPGDGYSLTFLFFFFIDEQSKID